ncbi:MAG TPA: hypothetical protein VIL55_09350 [Naasia sp.]|jgi:hypothetical protein
MLASIARLPGVLAQNWPALLAWYLSGALVRAAVIALAAPVGPQSALAALLLVPIAVLARLVSYIGMFLVVRRGLRTYGSLTGEWPERQSFRESLEEFLRILLATILPFFTLYGLIGLLGEDLSAYARAAFRYSLGSERGVLDVGDGPLVLGVVLVAFGGRLLLKYFGNRLPEWLKLVGVYLDATWVFVSLTALGALFGAVISWVEQRRVVDWVLDGRAWLSGLWEPIEAAFVAVDGAVPVVLQVLLLPGAWLLIAGAIYLGSLSHLAEERIVPVRVEAALRARLARLPRLLQRRAQVAADDWSEVWAPLSSAGRLILRSGPVDLAVFAAAYGLLYAAGQWLARGLYAAIGAHDSLFWFTVDPIASLAVNSVVEPVRIVLLAVAFDRCLALLRAAQSPRGNRSRVPSRSVSPEADSAMSTVAPS